MSRPTVAASLPRAFIDFAVARGASRRALIAKSQIFTEDLEHPNQRIDLQKYVNLIKAGIELCQEPALSLLFGEAVTMQELSIVGLIGEQANSVEEARDQVNRFARLMLDEDDADTSDRVQFVRDSGGVWIKLTSPLYIDNPLLTESGMARCVCGARKMVASSDIDFPKAMHFTYEEPSYRAEYDRVFRAPLFFNSTMNAIVVDEEFLSFKPPRTNPYLSQILTAHAEELLGDLERSKSTRGRVEALLIPVLHTGEANVEMIASKLGLSRQTLFRKLKADGVTFERVLDELRYKLARQYLNEKQLSINETAYLVGFSESAAFSRAFKRWTGSSPRSIRQRR
jgi:AraC-like DNA-binding protein